MDKETAALYAKLKPYKALVSKTRAFIRRALDSVERPYVACSFGKDSSVMLHLVAMESEFVHVKFLTKTETNLIDNYDDVVAWWRSLYNVEIEVMNYRGWLEGGTSLGIAKNMQAEEFDSFFVGIRKDESVARRISLLKDGMFYKMADGKTRIAPLAGWHTRDIATYMYEHNLPILSAYLREGFDARTTASISSKYPHESLARLKDRDIDAYNKLIQLFPDLKLFS